MAGVMVVLALIVAACQTPTKKSDDHGLRASFRIGAFDLTWNGSGAEYDVDMLPPEGAWVSLGRTGVTTKTVTDLTLHGRYQFRVRDVIDGSPGSWSAPEIGYYVEPKLPILWIDTVAAAPIVDRETYVPGTVRLDPNGSALTPYQGTMGIRGRGNSTWGYDKKPYKLKLDTKSALAGLPSEKDWVLLADAVDDSHIRTEVAFDLARATGHPWTPRMVPVEIVLNGEYVGMYHLAEQVEVSALRVGIKAMKDTDNADPEVTGGYLLEMDGRLEENNEPGFRTQRGEPIVVKDPDPATPAQLQYVSNTVDRSRTRSSRRTSAILCSGTARCSTSTRSPTSTSSRSSPRTRTRSGPPPS